MATIPVRQLNPDGIAVVAALESLLNPGTFYNWAGPDLDTFTAGPVGPDQLIAIPSATDPIMGHRAEAVLTVDDAAAIPGDYVLTFHDAADLAADPAGQVLVTVPGTGAGGAMTAGDVQAAVFARDIDGIPFAGHVSLNSAVTNGRAARDPDGTIRYRAVDDSADRVTTTLSPPPPAEPINRQVTLNPGA